jgi:hypothetical protein
MEKTMNIKEQHLSLSKPISGWFSVGIIALGFIALYLLNYLVPLDRYNYTTRLWEWTLLALSAGALLVIAIRWRSIPITAAQGGAVLGLISGWSYLLHSTGLRLAVIEGTAVWLTFMAGTALFRSLKEGAVPAFKPPFSGIARRIGLGILAAAPLVVVNNLFFYMQNGAPRFENIFVSAATALSPAIHEEAVFRYFVLAVCFTLLKGSTHPRFAMAAALFMAVVPHSLLHFPDLFLQNPMMGVGMLVATSLLFGLPMALLQVKISFESAVAFHWFIDFLRFWFGY